MNYPTKDAPEDFKHAWYSKGQADIAGTTFYRDIRGKEIEITEVCTSKDISLWDDAIYLGLVICYSKGGYIRKGKVGEYERRAI